MPIDRQELRRLAGACPKGKRIDDMTEMEVGDQSVAVDDEYLSQVSIVAPERNRHELQALADFTIAASPEAVLELLDELEQLRVVARDCEDFLEGVVISASPDRFVAKGLYDRLRTFDLVRRPAPDPNPTIEMRRDQVPGWPRKT